MPDLTISLGLDMASLEKGLAEAGRSIESGGSKIRNPFQKAADTLGSASGIGGLIGGPIGMMIGQFVEAFAQAIGKVIEYVKELVAYATKLRNLSIATGISVSELSSLEGLSQATGVSLETLAHAFNEFNKKAGEAKIRGSELNNILAKMGVPMSDITDGSFKAIDGMRMLAKAYEAGTDAQTLAYYGNIMFGSSFEQLLPIIKRGTVAIDAYAARSLKVSDDTATNLARAGDEWDNFWQNFKVIMMSALALYIEKFNLIKDSIQGIMIRAVAAYDPRLAGIIAEKTLSPSLSKEQRIIQLELIKVGMNDKDRKEFEAGYEAASGGAGKKLSPFGLSTANAASQMQQMGGGDIFGAIALSPLERIVDNTKQIAENTARKSEEEMNAMRPPDNLAR